MEKTTKKTKEAKKLIIVESPAKARTIKNFLGSDFEVIASKGHIRDLPKKSFGITIKDDKFFPKYELSNDHLDIIEKIKKLYKDSKITYIATDEDREGEAIGYHITQILDGDIEKFPRIVFHEITKNAILDSFNHARNIDMHKVHAQQARRLLDRIVGFKLSPLISSKIRSGLSAGRVQSSALKILVDREREIKNFVVQKYFMFIAQEKKDDGYVFDLISFENKKIDKLSVQDENEAKEILKTLKNNTYQINSIEKKEKITKSPPPFMTSTLQQSASSALGYSPTKTMSIAQKLYEGVETNNGLVGVITYMRTDSLNIAKEAINDVREYVQNTFGKNYLPSKAKMYQTKQNNAQEAHEAIRPTNINFTPQIAKTYLKNDELKLYTLIFNRFVASQMKDTIFESINVKVDGIKTPCTFKINGRRLIFDGFYKVLENDSKDKLLPQYKENEKIDFSIIEMQECLTEPPARLSEATLIKTMDNLGIGRPSTYAPTIRLLVDRDYISIDKKQIIVQDIAFSVMEILENNFNEIVDAKFSASLENELDEIAQNTSDWQKILWDFYEPFIQKIQDGKTSIKSQKKIESVNEECPLCAHQLVKRVGRYGEFIACSNYPKCKYIKKEKNDIEIEKSHEKCEKCGGDMIYKMGKNGKFLACANYPKCKNTKSINQLHVKCPKCGANIVMRKSKRGIFYGCSNYPKCDFISKNEPLNHFCKKCNNIMTKSDKKPHTMVCIACKNEEELQE